MKNRQKVLIILGAIAVVVMGIAGWYLGSPLIINRRVQEERPFDLPEHNEFEVKPDSEQQESVDVMQATATAMPDLELDESSPGEELPSILSQGQFQGVDNFHQGSGEVTIFERADGGRLLRFEDFMVTNGPGLVVLLAAGEAPVDREGLGTYLGLGPLKGNIGDQNYEIPVGADLSLYQSVVIYCEPFHVVFASAALSAPASN